MTNINKYYSYILAFLNICDMLFTLCWHGTHPELNPIMDWLIVHSVTSFVLAKLVASGLVIWVGLVSSSRRVGILLGLCCLVYIFVNLLHLAVLL